MSSRNLEYLLAPCSVALIGASDRPGSVGAKVMRNLLEGGFDGSIWPVNIRHATIAGKRAYAHVRDLPATPDLAVICTPAHSVPAVIRELGDRGTRAAVVITAGLDAPAKGGGTLSAAMLEAARPYKLRILGPNCLGLLLPRIGLNASFAHAQALPGNLAFIAQSGALATALLDWARMAQIGFSCLVSLGNGADVDFGDLLDYLCHDPHTRDPAVRRGDHGRAQVHVGRASSGAEQADHRRESRAIRGKRESRSRSLGSARRRRRCLRCGV